MITRRLADLAAVLATSVALAACSSTPSTDPVAGPPTVAPTTAAAPRATPVAATPVVTSPATASPLAAVTPCSANRARQAVIVRLRVQHLWLCERGTVVRETPITSGIPGEYTSTPTGRYTVQALTRDTSLTLISGQTYAVKYWIPFDGPLFGFHDSSWQEIPYGSQKYKKDGSHGCIHMPLAAIRFLYRWADVGAKVRITA